MFSKRRHLLIVAATLALLLAAGWLYTQRLPMARLRASGAPTTFADLAPEPIPAELNAAAGIEELQPRLEALPEAFWKVTVELPDDPSQLERAREMLAEHASLVAAVREAASRPRYASTTAFSAINTEGDALEALLGSVSSQRSFLRVLNLQGRVALSEGDTERATETANILLRLAKHAEQEPLVTGRLVACALQGIAIDYTAAVIAKGGLSPATAERLDQGLAAIEKRSSLTPTLESERVFTIETLKKTPPPTSWLESGALLRFYEEAIEAMDCPADQRLAAAQAIKTSQSLFASSLSDSLQGLLKAEDRTTTQAREARESLRAITMELPPLEP